MSLDGKAEQLGLTDAPCDLFVEDDEGVLKNDRYPGFSQPYSTMKVCFTERPGEEWALAFEELDLNSTSRLDRAEGSVQSPNSEYYSLAYQPTTRQAGSTFSRVDLPPEVQGPQLAFIYGANLRFSLRYKRQPAPLGAVENCSGAKHSVRQKERLQNPLWHESRLTLEADSSAQAAAAVLTLTQHPHPFRGTPPSNLDWRAPLTLTAPSGTAYHLRPVGIREDWPYENQFIVTEVAGEPVAGEWKVMLDSFPSTSGWAHHLQEDWDITFSLDILEQCGSCARQTISREAPSARQLATGTNDIEFVIDEQAVIADVHASLKVNPSWKARNIRTVALISPDGRLRARSQDFSESIDVKDLTGHPWMVEGIRGAATKGTWKLRVITDNPIEVADIKLAFTTTCVACDVMSEACDAANGTCGVGPRGAQCECSESSFGPSCAECLPGNISIGGECRPLCPESDAPICHAPGGRCYLDSDNEAQCHCLNDYEGPDCGVCKPGYVMLADGRCSWSGYVPDRDSPPADLPPQPSQTECKWDCGCPRFHVCQMSCSGPACADGTYWGTCQPTTQREWLEPGQCVTRTDCGIGETCSGPAGSQGWRTCERLPIGAGVLGC